MLIISTTDSKFYGFPVPALARLQGYKAKCPVVQVLAPRSLWIRRGFGKRRMETIFSSYAEGANLVFDSDPISTNFSEENQWDAFLSAAFSVLQFTHCPLETQVAISCLFSLWIRALTPLRSLLPVACSNNSPLIWQTICFSAWNRKPLWPCILARVLAILKHCSSSTLSLGLSME